MHRRTSVLVALPLPRHGESAAADLAASHTGLGILFLPIEGVPAHASAISTGAVAVFRACRRAPRRSEAGPRLALPDAQPDHLPVQDMADIHLPVFWPRGRLPTGAWLSQAVAQWFGAHAMCWKVHVRIPP